MPTPADLAADPAWLPHRVELPARRVAFIRVERAALADRGFLADRQPPPGGEASASFDEVAAMRPPAGHLHFLFHTAFCRSTLLVRALDAPGRAAGLNEPGILASIVNAGEAAAPLLPAILALLARPHAPGEAVFVKPTNHANRLMPALLAARPDARAVLMTNDLPAFLRAVARKGLMGRRWGRTLFLEMQSYAGMNFGMDPRETFALTDLQAAALAWLLAQRWFALHLGGQVPAVAPERLRVLDGDGFAADKARTFAALFAHAGIALDAGEAGALAGGAVFSNHAKAGGRFDPAAEATVDPRLAEEIAMTGEWAGLIMQQTGLPLPLKQTLF